MFRLGEQNAGETENVCAEDRPRGAGQVSVGDFLDERGDINAGGAGLDAGRVETKQAAVGFDDGFLGRVARRDLGHLGRRSLRSQLRTDWHRQKVQCPREQARSFADFYCSRTEVWLESKNYKISRRRESVKIVKQDLYG